MAKARIAVIGSGLMGHGIAQVFALAGHDVTITDSHKPNLDTVKQRIATNLRDLGDDEKAVERVRPVADHGRMRARCGFRGRGGAGRHAAEAEDLRRDREARPARHHPRQQHLGDADHARSCRACSDRERALGTHWWNPPFLVPLVEVIGTQWTSQAAIDFTMKLHADAGKMPAHVKKDVPGFIGNRLQHALWREAISLVERGICDAETVDKVIKAAFGRRLAVLGPLENADLVGTDLTLAIHKTVLPDIDHRPGPSPYLERLVAEGKLGFKSGEGFRKWSPEQQAALRAKVLQHLKKARATTRERSS